MTQEEQIEIFTNFLVEENKYSISSLHFFMNWYGVRNGSVPDITISQDEEHHYLAVINLKFNLNKEELNIALVEMNEIMVSFLKRGHAVSGFIVDLSVDNFLIYKRTWKGHAHETVKINKEQFPTFKELYDLKIQNDIFFSELRNNAQFENKKTKKLLNGIGYSAIIGFGAFTLSALFLYLNSVDTELNNDRLNENVRIIADLNGNINNISKKLRVVEEKLNNTGDDNLKLKKIENIIYKNVEDRLHKNIEGRVNNIESMLVKEPEKTLSILEIKAQIAEIESMMENANNLNNERITTLKERSDFFANLTATLAVTVFTTLVSVLIFFIQSKKS